MVDRLVNSEVNARRVGNVVACFGTSGQPLAVPGRVLVGEGVLVKMCRKKPKPRQFFLFNDILVYGNIIISKKRYNKQHIIPLEDVQLENLDDDGVKTRKKSFAVYAATSTEKKEWMLHIQRCVQDLLAKSGKTAATEHAAVWTPDSEARKCMACGKTQFGIIQRRHHCRACGKVICSACSTKKFLIDGVSRRPVRVCDACFHELNSGKSPSSRAATTTGTGVDTHRVGATKIANINQHQSPPSHPLEDDSSGEDFSDDDDDGGLAVDTHYDQVPTFYNEPPRGAISVPPAIRQSPSTNTQQH